MSRKSALGFGTVAVLAISIVACTHQALVDQRDQPSSYFAHEQEVPLRTPAQTSGIEMILAEDSDGTTPASLSLVGRSTQWLSASGQLKLDTLVGPYSNAEGAPEERFIRLAKASIDIEIYEMSDPAVRAALRDALKNKIKVRVVEEPKAIGHRCDVWADDGATPDCKEEQALRSEIVAAGGQFEKFDKAALCGQNPSDTSASGTGKKRGTARCYEHGKIIIVDRKLALISTGNFNSSNLCDLGASPKVCNRDYSYVTRDTAVVSSLLTIFEGDLAAQRQDIPKILATGGVGRKLTVSPYSFEPLKAFLESAHESIQLQNQYVNPGSGLEDVLMEMAQKGVKVEVQLSDLCSYGKPKETNSLVQKRLMFQEMETKGVKVRMFPKAHRINGKGGYLHAKAIVVDHQRAWMGSVNGSPTSLNVNREYGIFFNNQARARALSTYMKSDFDDKSSQTWQDSFECRGSRSQVDGDAAADEDDGSADQ